MPRCSVPQIVPHARRARARAARPLARLALAAVLPCVAAPGAAWAAESLDLGIAETGLSIGNSPRWRGVRINAVDQDIESIIGLNVTLWKPGYNDFATVTGIGAGLYGVGSEEFRGIGVSLISHRAARTHGIALATLSIGDVGGSYDDWPDESQLNGIGVAVGGIGAGIISGVAVAGLGIGAHDARGIFVAGLGAGLNDFVGIGVAGLGMGVNRATGVMVAGLGMGAEDVGGIAVAGLGMGTSDFTGIGVAGLGMGAHDVRGVVVTGLGMGAHDIRGIAVAGLGFGAHDVTGITVAGLGVGARDVRGLTVAGLGVGSDFVQGITVTAFRIKTEDMSGLAISPWNDARSFAHGVQIGLLNRADDLRGVQIGLLNNAGNKSALFRWLPGINMSF